MEEKNQNEKNDNNSNQNQKRIEYYINRLQDLNDNGEDIKMVIEDSFENQEREYEENNNKKKKKKDMSLVPLYIILVLGFNLIIYNKYEENNIFIPFITIAISLYLLFKYVPKKAKKKFIKDFEETFNNITNFFFFFFKNNDRENKLKKYISISSEDKNKLLNNNEKEDDNYMESPLLNI